MKLIRHILSHTILIGFVALMVLGFYYRAALFPAGWNQQISQQIDRIPGAYASKLHAFAAPTSVNATARVAAASSPQIPAQPIPQAMPIAPPAVVAVPAEIPQLAEPVAVKPVEDTTPAQPVEEIAQTTPAVAPAPTPVEAVTEVPVETPAASPVATVEAKPAPMVAQAPAPQVTTSVAEAAPAAPVTETKVPAPAVAEAPAVKATTDAAVVVEDTSAAPVVAQAPVSEPQPVQETVSVTPPIDEDLIAKGSSDRDFVGVNDLWLQARSAYGRGDLNAALQHYQSLSEQEVDNPDVFGELGNVYYAKGNFAEAGEAYYEAAVRLLERGQMTQMQYLVRVIEGLSPDKAEKLKQRLTR